jgi:PAX-interacting protein 1
MWKRFLDGTASATAASYGVVLNENDLFSGTSNLRDPFRRVLSRLQAVGEQEDHLFIQPLCEEPKFEIQKVIKRFSPLFDLQFPPKADLICWRCDDDFDRSVDARIPPVQIDASFVPKLKLPENIGDFRQRLLIGCPLLDSQWTEAIFPPNKPSQMAPSTKGPMLYMPGLIKFFLTDGQETKIWLEKIAGLKRSYRVTIIIDSSYSCFNDLMITHSVQTIFGFLRLLSRIDIPYFDLIVATAEAPRILAVNQSSSRAIDFQSFQLLAALFGALMENGVSSNMVDAMKVAMKIKSLSSAQRSYMFVFTDGIFGESQRNELKNLCRLCRDNMIEVFGIGIGRYPAGVFKLFSKAVWTLHPKHLITALSCFFGNEAIPPVKSISPFVPDIPKSSELDSILRDVSENWNDVCCYKDLYKFLRDQTLYQQSIPDFQLEDPGLDGGRVANPVFIPEKAMYKAGAFAGQKILVCCFWSKNIAGRDESDFIDPKYLTQRFPGSTHCVQDVLNHYGIKLEVVQNYKDGMLRMQTGEYYAIWVICGGGTGHLPDGGNPYFVDQFVRCIETYWKSGGAIV